MSCEIKKLANIHFVTDHDCGMYRLGELGGGFDETALKEYLEQYGRRGYSDLCSRLQIYHYQLETVMRSLISEEITELEAQVGNETSSL